MIELDEVLLSLRPTARWSVIGGQVEWHDPAQSRPSDQEIQQERARLQALRDRNQYQRRRAAEYPSIGDQLDDLFHTGLFSEEMSARIQAVKDRYPKPE